MKHLPWKQRCSCNVACLGMRQMNRKKVFAQEIAKRILNYIKAGKRELSGFSPYIFVQSDSLKHKTRKKETGTCLSDRMRRTFSKASLTIDRIYDFPLWSEIVPCNPLLFTTAYYLQRKEAILEKYRETWRSLDYYIRDEFHF